MDEEKSAAKRLFSGEKKPSMKRRDDYNDYADRRVYMITMEVEGRRPLFGRVEGDGLARRSRKDKKNDGNIWREKKKYIILHNN